MVILEKWVMKEDYCDYLNFSKIHVEYLYFLGWKVYVDSCSVYNM